MYLSLIHIYTASEYSLRTATITFAASEEATSDDVDLTENDDGTYTASADLFNKCADVYVGDTLYRFAAGLKSGDVTIDANDPWKVDFTIGGESFTNNAYNVQNPDIGTSTEPDGWTGIAYTVRGTLPSTANLSALSMTVVKRNAAATISGTAVTANSDGTYTLSLSGTDKMKMCIRDRAFACPAAFSPRGIDSPTQQLFVHVSLSVCMLFEASLLSISSHFP